jgi:DNA-binding transcriptional regulator YhcF (GntR family)
MSRKYTAQHLIHVDGALSTPIYRQIVNSILHAIENGGLQKGDTLPSVNSLATQFAIARGSIFKAYAELRALGTIDSTPGKGFFVLNTKQPGKKNIFLLMSTFNPYREAFYQAFIARLKNSASVDLYFHHHNINVFETLIQSHSSYYNTFVVMPEIHKLTKSILKRFDEKNLFILDTGFKEFSKLYAGIYQNYERDILQFFNDITDRLLIYSRVVLLFSGNMRNYDVIKGFERYFSTSAQSAEVITDTEKYIPQKGDLCLVMDDNDLVRLISYAKSQNWTLGVDFGIVSFNETPLKSIISEGITTISPDFNQMGIDMADMILSNRKEAKQNPFMLIDRRSF